MLCFIAPLGRLSTSIIPSTKYLYKELCDIGGSNDTSLVQTTTLLVTDSS